MTESMDAINGSGTITLESNLREVHGSTRGRKDEKLFISGFVLSQVAGLVAIVLLAVWIMKYLGGVAWTSDPNKQFNYHPLFMVMGLIFFYGDAILVYRALRGFKKPFLKILHAALHITAFALTVVALKAAFDYRNKSGGVHLYTIHSWIGITTVVLFTAQFVCGFIAFLFPELPLTWKKNYLPLHVFFGIVIFVMAIAAALMGLNEKLIWTMGQDYSKLPEKALLGNFLGIALIVFGVSVVYLVSKWEFKRHPLPGEGPSPIIPR